MRTYEESVFYETAGVATYSLCIVYRTYCDFGHHVVFWDVFYKMIYVILILYFIDGIESILSKQFLTRTAFLLIE